MPGNRRRILQAPHHHTDTPSSAVRRVRARFGRNLRTPALPYDATRLSEPGRAGAPNSCALLPLIPPSPFSDKGRRGSCGVLMPETGDGAQGLPQKPAPASILPAPFSHKGRRGSLGVLMPETGDGTQGLPQKPAPVSILPAPFSHEGRRGSLSVLMPETGDGTQGTLKNPPL